MAKVLRKENLDWKGISQAFSELEDADLNYLAEYEKELTRLGAELQAIGTILNSGGTQRAWDQYEALRTSIQTSRQAMSNQIGLMRMAQTNIHSLLT
jgi:hypothetical protein